MYFYPIWMSNPTRRKFLRTSGMFVGLSSITGLSSAQDKSELSPGVQNSITSAPVEIIDREVVSEEGEPRYCVVKVLNTDTGEIREAVAKIENSEILATEAVSGAVEVSRSDDRGSFSTQGWDDLYDEVKSGFAETIQRADWYRTTVDNCSYYSNYTHHLVGASIKYHEDINNLTATLLGAVIGAAAGLIAGYIGSPILSAILGVGGAAVGAVAGYALNQLKDSNILTFAAIDWGICAFGACGPGVMVSGSGSWKDANKDDMYHIFLKEDAHLHK